MGGFAQRGAWRAPGEPLGVPHPPAASPVLTLDAKTPQEMPPGTGMLLKGKDTGVSGKSPAIPHGSSPKPHPETPPRTTLTYFSLCHRLLLLLPGGMC